MEKIVVRNLYKKTKEYENKEITIQGWVRTIRASKNFGFIELNDGSFFKNIQIVISDNLPNFKELSKLTISSSIKVTGEFILTPNTSKKCKNSKCL